MKTATCHVFMCLHVDWTVNAGRVEQWVPEVWPCKVEELDSRVYIGPQVFDAEIPADFDPVPGQVAALRQQQVKALELYQRTVAEINERLQKLLAITNEAPEAA